MTSFLNLGKGWETDALSDTPGQRALFMLLSPCLAQPWALGGTWAGCSGVPNERVGLCEDVTCCAGLVVLLAAPHGRSPPANTVQICPQRSFEKQVMMATTCKLHNVNGLKSHKSRDAAIGCTTLWDSPGGKLKVHMCFYLQKSTDMGRRRSVKSTWQCNRNLWPQFHCIFPLSPHNRCLLCCIWSRTFDLLSRTSSSVSGPSLLIPPANLAQPSVVNKFL